MTRKRILPAPRGYTQQIMHYLIRHPCSTTKEIARALYVPYREIATTLEDHYKGNGMVDYCVGVRPRYAIFPNPITIGYTCEEWFVNDEWLDFALNCKEATVSTSKKYYEQILHFLLRYPCRTRLGILCAISGKSVNEESFVVSKNLDELCDKGIVDVCHTNFDGAFFYINNRWLDVALRCKGGY